MAVVERTAKKINHFDMEYYVGKLSDLFHSFRADGGWTGRSTHNVNINLKQVIFYVHFLLSLNRIFMCVRLSVCALVFGCEVEGVIFE